LIETIAREQRVKQRFVSFRVIVMVEWRVKTGIKKRPKKFKKEKKKLE